MLAFTFIMEIMFRMSVLCIHSFLNRIINNGFNNFLFNVGHVHLSHVHITGN